MQHSRRQFLRDTLGIGATLAVLPLSGIGQQKTDTRLILLGTKGGPRVVRQRSNAATLLLIGGVPYLVDCGYGVTRQLMAAGVPLNSLRFIFVTHHHSDHNLEYGTLLYNAWATDSPIRIDTYGPPGLEDMTRAFFEYMELDIATRMEDEGSPDPRRMITAHDVGRPGIVIQNTAVKVTAAKVRHPLIKTAYAYRFDAKDSSVVISGDTTYSPELAALSKGADVLVHEVMYLPAIENLLKRSANPDLTRKHLLASHSTPEDIGRVAAEAGVRTVVLTHFVPGDDDSITDDQWTAGVHKNFNGRVIVGKDLMEVKLK